MAEPKLCIIGLLGQAWSIVALDLDAHCNLRSTRNRRKRQLLQGPSVVKSGGVVGHFLFEYLFSSAVDRFLYDELELRPRSLPGSLSLGITVIMAGKHMVRNWYECMILPGFGKEMLCYIYFCILFVDHRLHFIR